MSAEDRIKGILRKFPYGLTNGEIAAHLGMSEASAARFLDKMSGEKKIAKSRANKTFFYRSLEYSFVMMLILLLPANALEMNSSTYRLQTVLDSGGNRSDGTTRIVFASIGQVSGTADSQSFDLCSGFLCNFIEYIINARISFLLEFNINGSSNDTAFVDNYTAYSQYTKSQLSNYYACIHDVSIAGSPAIGIMFAGSGLNYINISSGNSSILRMSQDIPGNEFIIPITVNNCTVLGTKTSQIAQFGTLTQPFVAVSELINAIELILNYPSVDIAGSFDRTGAFTIDIAKNESNENQIIIKPT